MDSWELLSQEDILEFLAPLLKAGLTKADIVSLAKTSIEGEAPQPTVSPAKTSIEGEAPQPTATDVPSPSRSHATVVQPQPEKNYATQAMINLVQTVEGSEKNFNVHMVDTGGQPEFIETMVIGTHHDCVKGKLTEALAAVNKELKSIFLPAMEDELIVYRSYNEIMFPVNLLEPDDNDKIVQ